uniref:ABC transporter permease n=1 Tax=Streptomyces sp. NBC_00049 TaxID=2903617 RepID=A0AAU2JL96_9ACTN
MSAPAHTRSLPSAPRATTNTHSGADARLHWWALALPALAFGLLLLLLAGSGEAQAATGGGSALGQVAAQLLRAVA